jgi:hypothetical protein
MVKKAYPSGLLYLCQTSTKDPYLYKGSGKRWLNHVVKHKSRIVTCVLGTYDTQAELREAGIYFSRLYNVVESDEWANLMEENGTGGNPGCNGELWKKQKQTATLKKTIAATSKEEMVRRTTRMLETRDRNGSSEKIRKAVKARTPTGVNHWNHSGLWVVNHNTYVTIEEAAAGEGINRWTVNEYCNNPDICFTRKGKFGIKGKTRRECGFYRK